MKIIKNWRKKRAIARLLNKPPLDLATAYGTQVFYSDGQVNAIANKKPYHKQYTNYALVSFLSEQEAISTIGNAEDVKTLRQEVAYLFFDGNIRYASILAQKRKNGNSGHCSLGSYDGGATGD